MERKLVAILSTDVKGYSRLMGEDEVAALHTFTTYHLPTALAWAILLRDLWCDIL